MQEINYIKHLNAVFNQFSKDNRLNPTHISLYIALFQLWNLNRFLEEFFINRDEVMQLSKIGSKSTYHRCIKELNHWKYIVYFPSHNPYRGSKIKMFKFGTSTGQALVPIYKHIQTIKNKNSNKQENFKNSDFNDSENNGKHNSSVPNRDNLKTTKNKNYNEPL
tara:strand:+ start:292 stop:783 length:492 start_codon:yes stop_codon:yes gene_type:complete